MTLETTEDIPDFDSFVPAGKMAAIIQRYSTDRSSLERKYPTTMSETRRTRMRRFAAGWLGALDTADFESLCHEDQIDFLLLRNHLDFYLRRLDQYSAKLAEMSELVPFMHPILRLDDARVAMEWADPEQAAGELAAIAESAELLLQSVKAQPAEKTSWRRPVVNRAAQATTALVQTLKSWYQFYSGFDPLFTWWAEAPFGAAVKQLEAYKDYLVKEIVKPDSGDAADIIGDPIGKAALEADLAFEMIAYSPEELIEIARRELAWCEAEMARAAGELGYGEDTRAALEHVKRLHARPGGQPELVKQHALEAIDYLDTNDLLTVPPLARETWRLEMMSAERQKVNPFFLGGEVIQVSFPTHTMSHAEKQMSMRGNNAHFARATVQHELIPGHHLQGFMQDRHRTYREPFCTPFWIEGWTIYWEFLLYNRGFPKCAEDRIGMLFWRIHRCVRVIFSISFHLEKMTPTECIEMLVELVGHERANAVAEVRRSCSDTYPPLYQCAYLIGGLQMWALRRELVDSGKMSEKAFHDAVIRENCIPIEMVRADLAKQNLSTDFNSTWRFYGDISV